MSQAGILNTTSSPSPTNVATSYVTNSGTAVPASNILNVLGTSGIVTSGAGNTITLTLNQVAPSYVDVVGPTTYDVTATDYFISCNSTAGAITIRLPNAPTTYDQFVIKDRTGTVGAPTNNPITITTVGGVVTIDGDTSVSFIDNYESLELIFNGTSYETF